MTRPEIDPGLITAAQEGCQVAFGGLVKATYDDTYSLALRLTGNPSDAEDVAQDTYLRAFTYLGRFRGDAHVRTWLHRITVNCASNVTAKRGRVRRHEESASDVALSGPPADSTTDPAEQATADDLRTRLLAAVEALPPKLRDVVVLRDVTGLPHEAIADRLGISETAAKVRLHRARLRLREQLFGDELPGGSRSAPGADQRAGRRSASASASASASPAGRGDARDRRPTRGGPDAETLPAVVGQ